MIGEWGYPEDSISITWLRAGAPPPARAAGPHPRGLPALASLAPMITHIEPLGLAIWSASLSTELLNPALSLISADGMLIQAAKGC